MSTFPNVGKDNKSELTTFRKSEVKGYSFLFVRRRL